MRTAVWVLRFPAPDHPPPSDLHSPKFGSCSTQRRRNNPALKVQIAGRTWPLGVPPRFALDCEGLLCCSSTSILQNLYAESATVVLFATLKQPVSCPPTCRRSKHLLPRSCKKKHATKNVLLIRNQRPTLRFRDNRKREGGDAGCLMLLTGWLTEQ